MNTLLRLILISLFCLGVFGDTCFVFGSQKDIKLCKSNKTIVAPEASDYVWYLNGTRLKNTGRKVKVTTAGIYEVKMTNANGEVIISRIGVGIKASGEVYKIILIGDSTVCYYNSGWYPLKGWGMMLPYFFDSTVTIVNEALGGRSAKSFYNDHWAPIREALNPGDFVFIGFGINDAKSDDPDRYTAPFEGFQDYLTLFAEETQAKGAFPVIVSTVRRNSFNADGTVYDAWHDYPVASRQLAHELDLPLIDLDSVSVPLYESLGPDYVGPFLYMNLEAGEYPNHPSGYSDNVHFQENGATEMARLVIEEISKYTDDTIMNRLIPHIKPMYEVATTTNFPDLAMISRTASYPEGIPVTVKAKFADTIDLLEWQDGDGETMATTDRYKFTMDSEPITLTAILDDDPELDCSGEINGLAYYDSCGVCAGGTTGILPCNSETSSGIYKLTSVRSHLCINEGEEKITQETCIMDNSQFWEFMKDGSLYKIKNYSSGQYLGFNACILNIHITGGTEEILWRMEKFGGDTFYLVPQEDPVLRMEVIGFDDAGTELRLYSRNTSSYQKFIIWETDPEDCSGYPCITFNGSAADAFQFQIAPNPASGHAILKLSSVHEHPVAFELYDLQGKRVINKTNITDRNFEFGYKLSKGVYIAKVIYGKYIHTLKFIKY